MKISKLFHCLYGLVMLLPLFAIGVTCCYAMFNKNAYQSYDGTIEYQENVNVEKPTDLINGRTYNITIINNEASTTNNASYRMGFTLFTLKDYLEENGTSWITTATQFAIGGAVGYTDHSCFSWYDTNNTYLGRTELPLNNNIVNNLQFQFSTLNTTSPAYFTDSFKNLINVYNNVLVYENTLSNVFYASIDKVQQSPLFNWAQNSFLVTPFAYIVSLFSMPQNSFIVMLLSYWLAISIIWLVFDLIMYVPLLVHRWIDKGVLE